MANVLSFEHPVAPLTVGTIDAFIEYFMARHIEPGWIMSTTSPLSAPVQAGGCGFPDAAL